MRFFGPTAGESDVQREQREHDEAQRREDRDAAGNARQRAVDLEAERQREWQRIQDEGQSGFRALREQLQPTRDDSPEARAARTDAARRAGELEQERRRDHAALRQRVAQEAIAARDAMPVALDIGDIEGYVSAHNRLAGLERLLRELDERERVRQQAGAMPVLHGILHGAGRAG